MSLSKEREAFKFIPSKAYVYIPSSASICAIISYGCVRMYAFNWFAHNLLAPSPVSGEVGGNVCR